MRTLHTIQKRQNLNIVNAVDEIGPGGANHLYAIIPAEDVETDDKNTAYNLIQMQCGPRNEKDSTHGIIDSDLLEIVRDRLKSFQKGPFASEYNQNALIHIEEALMWMNRRVEDRIERNVLGKYEK